MAPESNPTAELLLTNALADAAQRGKAEQFSELYARVSPSLFVWAELRIPPWARRHLGPDDLVQEVWARSILKLDQFDATKGTFRTWLFGFSRRTLSEFLRKGLRSQGSGIAVELTNFDRIPSSITSLSQKMIRKSAGEDLAQRISALEADDKRLFLLRALEERPHEVIAEELGISRDSAKKKWQRLRVRLESEGLLEGLRDES